MLTHAVAKGKPLHSLLPLPRSTQLPVPFDQGLSFIDKCRSFLSAHGQKKQRTHFPGCKFHSTGVESELQETLQAGERPLPAAHLRASFPRNITFSPLYGIHEGLLLKQLHPKPSYLLHVGIRPLRAVYFCLAGPASWWVKVLCSLSPSRGVREMGLAFPDLLLMGHSLPADRSCVNTLRRETNKGKGCEKSLPIPAPG